MVVPIPAKYEHRSRKFGAFAVSTALWRADRYGNRISQIPAGYVTSGSLRHSDASESPRTFTFEVNNPDDVLPFRDFVIPEITLTTPDGVSRTTAFGLFMASPPKTTFSIGHRKFGSIEGKDAVYLLSRSAMPPTIFNVGQDTGWLARHTAISAGFSLQQVDMPNTGYLLTQEHATEPGMSRLDAINMLYQISNWRPLWMSNANRLKSRPIVLIQDRQPTRTYSNHDAIVEVLPNITSEFDWTGLANHVVGHKQGNGEDEPDLWSSKWITNPAHPLYYSPSDPSASNIPIELTSPDSPEEMNEIETQAALDLAVLDLLSRSSSMTEKIRMTTVVDLDADAYDVLNLDIKSGDEDVYVGSWWRDGWTVAIDGIVGTTDSTLYASKEFRG